MAYETDQLAGLLHYLTQALFTLKFDTQKQQDSTQLNNFYIHNLKHDCLCR